MAVRLIFLSFFKIPTEGRRLNGKRAAGMVRCFLVPFRVVKCARYRGNGDSTTRFGSCPPNVQEKLLRVTFKETVLKLTQVGE